MAVDRTETSRKVIDEEAMYHLKMQDFKHSNESKFNKMLIRFKKIARKHNFIAVI